MKTTKVVWVYDLVKRTSDNVVVAIMYHTETQIDGATAELHPDCLHYNNHEILTKEGLTDYPSLAFETLEEAKADCWNNYQHRFHSSLD